MSERIHKLLAHAGVGSRREIERWIAEGLITVNGRVAKLGQTASLEDEITLRGEVIKPRRPEQRVIVYHKPEGEVTTRADPQERTTVFEHLPRLRNGRWIAVGRLDINTAGLLLFTTDGELAHRLMHPSTGIEREYAVRVLGQVEPGALQNLLNGVTLDDGPAQFESITEAGGTGANHWYHVVIKEGRQREVRRLWESQGVTVSRLIRIRYGPIQLGAALYLGRWRELEPAELRTLYQAAGLRPPRPARLPAKATRPPRSRRS